MRYRSMLLALLLILPACATATSAPQAPVAPAALPAGEVPGGGLYGGGSWSRLGLGSTAGVHPGGEFTLGNVLSPIVELRTGLSGLRRQEGALPGIDRLGPTGAPGNFATEDDPVWDFDVEAALGFYLLQPGPTLPFGLHVGGFGDYTRFLGSITPSVGEYFTLSYGGEGGVFYRGGTGTVVRGAVQYGRIQYRSEQAGQVSEPVTNLLVGLEPRLGGLGLGGWGGRKNGERFVRVGLIFR